jgi:hypothetical protein
MDLYKLNSLILKTAQAVKKQESFFTGALAVKAEQLAELYPYDNTVVAMNSFLNKRASSQPLISREELNSAYNTLYTHNNKFALAFKDELGLEEVQEIKREAQEELDVFSTIKQNVDSNLIETISTIFDKSAKVKNFSEKSAKLAERNVAHTLHGLGATPKFTEIISGNQDWLICRAAFETPKGETSVLLPVEVVNDQPIMPTSLVSTEGLIELTSSSIKDYLIKNAGKLLQVNAGEVLTFLNKTAEPLSEAELALFRLKTASADSISVESNGVYLKDALAEEKIVDYSVEIPEEYKNFGDMLSSKAGEAELLHGKKAVELARETIIRKLSSFGYKAQVGIASCDKDMIVFAASVDGIRGFKVPVKIENSVPLMPKTVIADSSVNTFTAEGVSELIAEANDTSSMAMSSAMYDLKPQELFINIYAALQDNNLLKAEDALHILKESGDKHFYDMGFALYKSALKGELNSLTKNASCGCSSPVKTKNSSGLICSHTGLPVNKVYQDKFGQCRPMHRQGLENGSEDAHFITSKVYWNC